MVLDTITRIMHTVSPLNSYNLQRWLYLVVTSCPEVINFDFLSNREQIIVRRTLSKIEVKSSPTGRPQRIILEYITKKVHN